jgi:hypothetical protein
VWVTAQMMKQLATAMSKSVWRSDVETSVVYVDPSMRCLAR